MKAHNTPESVSFLRYHLHFFRQCSYTGE